MFIELITVSYNSTGIKVRAIGSIGANSGKSS